MCYTVIIFKWITGRERSGDGGRLFVLILPRLRVCYVVFFFIFPSRIESEKGASFLSTTKIYNIHGACRHLILSRMRNFFFYISRERFLFFFWYFQRVHPSRWNRLLAIYYHDIPTWNVNDEAQFPIVTFVPRVFAILQWLPLAINGNREKEKRRSTDR